jgi:uncharacterized protein (DUF4415 family)
MLYKQHSPLQLGKLLRRKGNAMKTSSNPRKQALADPVYEKFKDLDFSNAKPVSKVAHLQTLQTTAGLKSRITMRVDSDVVAVFRARAAAAGTNYQTMMNDALKQFAQGVTMAEMLDASVRETIGACLSKNALPAGRRKQITA